MPPKFIDMSWLPSCENVTLEIWCDGNPASAEMDLCWTGSEVRSLIMIELPCSASFLPSVEKSRPCQCRESGDSNCVVLTGLLLCVKSQTSTVLTLGLSARVSIRASCSPSREVATQWSTSRRFSTSRLRGRVRVLFRTGPEVKSHSHAWTSWPCSSLTAPVIWSQTLIVPSHDAEASWLPSCCENARAVI